MDRILLATLMVFLLAITSSQAEHREALLIGPAGELTDVAADWEKKGIRCRVLSESDSKKLKSSVEHFANHSPTNGSAIVLFSGEATPDDAGDIQLHGTKGSYAASDLLAALAGRGGSRSNLLIIDSPRLEFESDVPDGCRIAFGGAELLETLLPGIGKKAVSAPGRFVPGKKIGDEWVNSRGTVFCWCPPGKFTAGSPPGTPGRFPDEAQREVVIPHGFWISKYELTATENPRSRNNRPSEAHKNLPLTMVNHDDAKQMTLRILTEEGRKLAALPDDWQYSLPTEEQWEYAARAGTTTNYSFGDNQSHLPEHANFGDKSYYDSLDIFSNSAHRTLDDGAVRAAPVGSYKPNAWGLHDVHGNVAEWCLNGAIRGGGWVSSPENCRSAYRDHFSSRNQQPFIGYRIVIQPIRK